MRPPSRPPESERDVLGGEPARPREPRPSIGTALKISVINGDLLFVRQPLLIGHYVSLRLTGTEGVVDKLLDSAMSKSLAAGCIPTSWARIRYSSMPRESRRSDAIAAPAGGDRRRSRSRR
jgi:hypothetical protein